MKRIDIEFKHFEYEELAIDTFPRDQNTYEPIFPYKSGVGVFLGPIKRFLVEKFRPGRPRKME